MRKSPTEDNLSPNFWTCFSHYHEKVATLRNAFFDITHSGRKKHSSLLGALLAEMPPAQKNTPRCKGRFRGRCPPAPKKTSLVVRDVFFGADNQIRTGDLVLTKDVLYLLSHISKILRATCGKVRIAPRLSLSMIPILPAKVNRLR